MIISTWRYEANMSALCLRSKFNHLHPDRIPGIYVEHYDYFHLAGQLPKGVCRGLLYEPNTQLALRIRLK
jgi:hypothetical protein